MSLIRRIDLRGADRASVDYRASVPRAEFDVEAATHQVQPILDAVQARGVEAIAEYSAEFDGVDSDDIAVLARGHPGRARGASTRPSAPVSRSRSAACAMTCEAELEPDVTSEVAPGAVVTHRKVADRPGRASTSPAASRRW